MNDSATILAALRKNNPGGAVAVERQLSRKAQLPGNLALRRRATSNMRAGDSVSQDRRATIDPACPAITIEIPVRTWNESNMHDHWRNRKRRVLTQRLATRVAFNAIALPPLPVVMKFTRLAPRMLDEGDGLLTAFKAVRDEIADLYGVDDRNKRYRWEYAQERSKTYGVRVEIRAEGMR